MADEVAGAAGALTARAKEMVEAAKTQAVESQESLAAISIDPGLADRIRARQEAIGAIVEEIASIRDRIAEERAAPLGELARVRQAVAAAEAEMEGIRAQITSREASREEFSNRTVERDFGPLGKVVAPDPEARVQSGALLVEIAGLRTALATAERTAAVTRQTLEALELDLDFVPADADPRVIRLYSRLEVQKKTLAALTEQALAALTTSVEHIFTEDNKKAIARRASREIPTGLPDDVAADVFYGAIEKVEASLVDAIPRRALDMINGTAGLSDVEADKYVARLTEKLNSEVDVPMLDEEEEGAFFDLLVRLLTRAMMAGGTIDELLDGDASTKTS